MKNINFNIQPESAGSRFDAYRELLIQDKKKRVQRMFNEAAELLLMGRTGKIHVDEVAKRLSCDNQTAFTALVTLFKKGKDIIIIND